jgi:hypothetical protein
MARSAELCERRLQLTHLRSKDELAMAEHARDCLVNRAPEPPPLRGKINERDGRRLDARMLSRDRQCKTP